MGIALYKVHLQVTGPRVGDDGELIYSRDLAWATFVALIWFALQSFFPSWLILRHLRGLLRKKVFQSIQPEPLSSPHEVFPEESAPPALKSLPLQSAGGSTAMGREDQIEEREVLDSIFPDEITGK